MRTKTVVFIFFCVNVVAIDANNFNNQIDGRTYVILFRPKALSEAIEKYLSPIKMFFHQFENITKNIKAVHEQILRGV